MIIYGIYDKKAESFKEIIQAENDDMCKRILMRILSAANNSDYVMFPFDFSVYRLANFNQRNGSVYGKDVKAIAFELYSLFNKPDESAGTGTDPADQPVVPSASEDSERSE